MYRIDDEPPLNGAWIVTLLGALEPAPASMHAHAPARSAARDAIHPEHVDVRLTQRLSPRRLATPQCLRSLLARLEARALSSGVMMALSLDGDAPAAPLQLADAAVLDAMGRGERAGPAFTLEMRAQPWAPASAAPLDAFAPRAADALRARQALFAATGTHAAIADAVRAGTDAVRIGPFDAGTSLHLVCALLVGSTHDALRKSLQPAPASSLAAFERAREDLGNAFIDAWIAEASRARGEG